MLGAITQFFNIDTTIFTILNYPMSYVEFFGTIFTLGSVWLVAKKNILNWPIGLVGVVLFAALFYQIQLYADLFEQFYYFVTGIIGWYAWARSKGPKEKEERIQVESLTNRSRIYWAAGIAICTLIGAWAMSRIHIWLPSLFPLPASFVLLDVFTTVLSFAATILMIRRQLENWVLWIVVDVIAIGLYFAKGVPFIALLYALFLGIAINGFYAWRSTYRRERDEQK